MLDKNFNSSYTISVDLLVKAIHGRTKSQSSLFEQAAKYFRQAPENAGNLAELKQNITQLEAELDATPLFKFKSKAKLIELEGLEKQLKDEVLSQKKSRVKRLNNAISACLKILHASEGGDLEETELKSGKFLATMLLFSPGEGKKLAELHHSLKPAYKTVLSLRLLDKLIREGIVQNPYILAHYDASKRYDIDPPNKVGYTQSVILPVMLAAIFQDVGWQHPDVEAILDGEEGDKDRFRLLDKSERDEIAKLNYQYTIDYLENGLGCLDGVAASKEEKQLFTQAESSRLKFQSTLVRDASSIKFGVSEIIKIPQLYSSIVFSTKREFSSKSLPNASLLISQLAQNNKISKEVAENFVGLVGRFPLGYGIAFIPKGMGGKDLDHYEYAIVTGLSPENIDEPNCRVVSRNLLFLEYARNEVVDKARNMYFEYARKKLEKVPSERLIKIRENLTHQFDPDEAEDLVPSCWNGYNYFFLEGYQNLWNQVVEDDD